MVHQPVLYPRIHPWYLVVAALDVLLTWFIITTFYGVEVNPLAAKVIETGGMSLATFYKFLLVGFVMWACEYIGRHRPHVGRHVLFYAVIINACVVIFSLTQIAAAM
jgi:hypothetical protein